MFYRRLWKEIRVVVEQFGFLPGRWITNAIFAGRHAVDGEQRGNVE